MKTKKFFGLVIFVLFLAILACGPVGTSTPTVLSPTILAPTIFAPTLELPTALPTATPTRPSAPTPSLITLSPTLSPPTALPIGPNPIEVPSTPPQPTTTPQSAAPKHYKTGDPIQLDEIHMISSTEGWGISGAYVLVTTDGGLTWREATPPEKLPSGTPDKAYGAFLDKLTAWIVFSQSDQILPEASVWHTTDGGRTWTPSAPLFHQVNGQFVWAEFATLDKEKVWLMVRGVYAGAGTHHSHELFRTTDGGLTWTSLDGEISDDYTGMVFADASTGWRTWQTTGAYAAAPPDYGVTTDGGANWDSRGLPPPPDAPDLFDVYPYCETYQPILLSTQSIRLLVGCFDAHYPPNEFTSYLYTSEDGGASWNTYKLPEKVLASDNRLIYFEADNALLLGRDMYRSADGGRTWSHVKVVNWDGQFSFVDPLNGWAVALAGQEVALVKTTDGGSTWVEIKPTIRE